VGPDPRARDWAVGFSGGEEAHYRRRWRTPYSVVRLLLIRRPTPEEYDSWARAPVPEAGPLLSAEMKRRTTAGGGMLFTRQFAFFTHEGRHPRSMTRGPRPPCQRLGHLGARRARSSVALRGVSWGNLSLKRDSPSVVAILITRSALSPSSSPRSSTAVATMALLDPLERFHPEVALNLVRNPLGWGVPTFAGRICVGSLTVGEFVLFVSNLLAGWRYKFRLSSCYCWRGLASNLYTLRPASSFRRPSSPTSTGCPWGRRSFPLLPSAFGGKDVRQPREGGHRAKLRLLPSRPQLLGVGSELCCGSISSALMASVPPPMVTAGLVAEDAARGVVQDVVRRGDGVRALSARPY
jgi:hypothetical protein